MEHQMVTQVHHGTKTSSKPWPSANWNMKPYIRTMGSATPRIRSGWPPIKDWIEPEIAVEMRTCTPLKAPFVRLSICSPNARPGITEAKKMYTDGAKTLQSPNNQVLCNTS